MVNDNYILQHCYMSSGKIKPSIIKLSWLDKHLEIKNYLLNRYDDITNKEYIYTETLYRIFNNIDIIPKCKTCGKDLKYIVSKHGYGIYCSKSCAKKDKDNIGKDVTDINIIINDLLSNGSLNKSKIRKQYLISHGYLNLLLSLYTDTTNISEIIYRYINNIEYVPNCQNCGKPVLFISFNSGYSMYCSYKCEHHYNIKKNMVLNDDYIINFFKDKRNKTNIEYLKDIGIYEYLNNRFNDLEDLGDNYKNIREVIYRIENNIIKKPVCDICGKPLNFSLYIKNNNGYGSYIKSCSDECKKLSLRYKRFENLKKHTGFDIEYKDYNTFIFNNVCLKHPSFEINPTMAHNRCLLNRYKLLVICPICNPFRTNESSIEIIIKLILNDLNVNYILHNRSILDGKELDFFCPDYNIAIECNGLYWHSTKHTEDYKYHYNKYKLCEKQNIELISLWEDDIYEHIEKIINLLKVKFGKICNKIYARNCEVLELTSKLASLFVDTYHLLGNVNASIKLGLFYNNELVEVMTFGKLRKPLGSKSINNEYELYRLCTKSGIIVIGGASKLFSYFKNNYSFSTIISYCHNDISNGNIYKLLGFNYSNETIGYFYYDLKNNKRINRFTMRKSNIDDGSGRTAEEIINDDYNYLIKCYNSGVKKFIYKNL